MNRGRHYRGGSVGNAGRVQGNCGDPGFIICRRNRYDLRPESHVRFAAADALFLAKDPTDPEGTIDQRAAKILVGRKKVTAAQVKSAAAEGQGHLGERLLLETDLQVSDWVRFLPGKVAVPTTGAVLPASVSLAGLMIDTLAVPVWPAIGLPRAGLPSSVRRRILPTGWFGSCAGQKR